MHKLYELKNMLCEELEEYGAKDKLDVGGLEIVDKLAHAIKNIDKIIEAYDDEEGYSNEGGRMYPYFRSYEGGGRGGSYARGRGRNARRDSMGRYSSNDGYSRAEDDMHDMIMELREMMPDLPQEKQMEVKRFIQKIEQM